jgi:hypothetical protein
MTTNNTVTPDMIQELEAARERIRQLEAEKAAHAKNGMKITPKGGLSVYGLGRFPVTLYKSQWLKLLGMCDAIRAFIEANSDKLTDKAKADEEVAA